jgi:hypothetical protein
MGRQSGNIFRTTISVPLDLKERMDAVTEQVNWSTVACRAFEQELAEIASRKEEKTMDDVVQRLRAAAMLEAKEEYRHGVEKGRAWVNKSAAPRQLRRLQELDDHPVESVRTFLQARSHDRRREIAHGLYKLLNSQEQGARKGDVEAFWREVLGNEGARQIEDFDFALGFCHGALGVWDKVKCKL